MTIIDDIKKLVGLPTTPSTPEPAPTQQVQNQQSSQMNVNPYSVPQTPQQAYGLPATSTNQTSSNTALDNFTKAATQTPQEAYNVPSSSQHNSLPTSNLNNVTPSAGSNQTMQSVAAQSYNPNTTPLAQFNQMASGTPYSQPQSSLAYKAPAQDNRNIIVKALDTYFDPNTKFNKFMGAGPAEIDPVTGLPTYRTAPIALPGAGPLAGGAQTVVKDIFTNMEERLAAEAAAKAAAANVAKTEANSIITKLEQNGADILAGNLGKEVAEAATGNAVKTGVGEVATNTATSTARLSWLQKFIAKFKYPLIVASAAGGWVTTGVYSQNELGDTVQSLQMKADEVRKSGDIEAAQEIVDRMKELEKLNSVLTVLKGPIGYLEVIGYKIGDGVSSSQDAIDRDKAQLAKEQLIEAKYKSDTATPEEIADYISRNPYSAIAAIEKNKEVEAAKEAEQKADPNTPYGTIGPNGEYIPSAYELAKRKEQQAYYDSLKTQPTTYTPQEQQQYEPPSSLNFGLLKTAGGYMVGPKNSTEGTLVTDTGTVAEYYFGVSYNQLTAEQKALVDMMTSS